MSSLSVAKAGEAKKKRTVDDWEVRNALDTLQHAEEIKRDPEMIALVKELAKKRLQDMASVAGQVANLPDGKKG